MSLKILSPLFPLLVVFSLITSSASAQNCGSLPTFNVFFNNQIINAAQVFTNQNIRITGTVTFNANITFVRCTVLLDPNALLIIDNNSTFTALADAMGNRTVFFGCTQMWDAIDVRAGSAIIFRNCVVRDGIRGIVFNDNFNNGLTELQNNVFSRNTAAITATNVGNFTFGTMTGNTFTGRQSLAPLLPPHAANQPINAFNLTNVSGVIGTAGNDNEFYAFTTAVLINSSTVTVNNCIFSGNTLSDWNGAQRSGIGIWASNSDLTIQNVFSNNASCVFRANIRGVVSDRTVALTLQDASFTDARDLDIEVANSFQPCRITIANNAFTVFTPTIGCMAVQRSAQAMGTNTVIRSNVVTLQQNPGSLLANNVQLIVVTAQPGALDAAVIADNQVTSSYGNGPQPGGTARTIDGIIIQGNSDNNQISGNIINYVNPAMGGINANVNSVGIGVINNGGNGNLVGPNNTITSTRFPNGGNQRDSWLRCGIHIDNSPNTLVCQNDVDDPRHAYHFLNNCANVEFGRNKIRDAIQGLVVWGAMPNNHDYRMNEWIPGSVYNTFSAVNTGGALTWRVDGTLPGHMPPPTINNNWIFTNAPNGGQSGTPVCDRVVPPIGEGERIGEMVHGFLNGGIQFDRSIQGRDYERYLLTSLLRFPGAGQKDPALQRFLFDRQHTALGKLAQADYQLEKAVAISADLAARIAEGQAQLQALQARLSDIVLQEDKNDGKRFLALQEEKRAILLKRMQYFTALTRLNERVNGERLAQLEPVRRLVEELPETNAEDAAAKRLLTIKVKNLMGEDWSDQDYEVVRSLAHSCMAEAGEAVLDAQALLPAPESIQFDHDHNLSCSQERSAVQELPASAGLMVQPNPASRVVTVEFPQPFSGQVQLVSTQGAVLLSRNVRESVREAFDVEELPAGLYLLIATDLSGSQHVDKLSVQR